MNRICMYVRGSGAKEGNTHFLNSVLYELSFRLNLDRRDEVNVCMCVCVCVCVCARARDCACVNTCAYRVLVRCEHEACLHSVCEPEVASGSSNTRSYMSACQ